MLAEWLPTAFPFAEGPRVQIRLSPAVSRANLISSRRASHHHFRTDAKIRFGAMTQALAVASDELAAADEQWLTLAMLREEIDDVERKS